MSDKKFKVTLNGLNFGAKMVCPACGNEDMDGDGGSFGGRITSYRRKCPDCEYVLLIVPMQNDYTYIVSAKTEEERNKDWKTRQKIQELEKEADDLRRSLR